jgi:hypothetical protein
MTTLTIASSNLDTKTFISIQPPNNKKWTVKEWDQIVKWCANHLDPEGLEWIPIPQKRVIFMQQEAYFMYTLQNGPIET